MATEDELRERVALAALDGLFDRKGIKYELQRVRYEDAELWADILEEAGQNALAALRPGDRPSDGLIVAREENDGCPNNIRGMGWSVAVHNDYQVGDTKFTFWLFTHPNGTWIKGEGRSDAEALNCIRAMLAAQEDG